MKKPFLPVFLLAAALEGILPAKTIPNHAIADLVLGQKDFTSSANLGARSYSLESPSAITVDPVTGKVFVADSSHDRILRYASAASLTNGSPAEAVFGQVRFTSSFAGSDELGLSSPTGLFFDRRGRLWVADNNNNRVLMFEAASYRSMPAYPDLVLGQPNFTTVTPGTTADKMRSPTGLWVDQEDRLWVADFSNHRILRFDFVSLKTNGAAANLVLGQPDFASTQGGMGPSKMLVPCGLFVTPADTLWVLDHFCFSFFEV